MLYYGDWLPNTYYLKMEGFPTLLRIERGLYVFAKFAWNLGPVFFLLPLLVMFFRRDRVVLLLALLFIGQVAYSVYVGGDAWEHRGGSNRFLTLGMPFFFILFVMASNDLFDLLRQHGLQEFNLRWQKVALPGANLAFVGFVFLALVNFNVLLDGNSLKQWVLIDPNIFAPGSQRYLRDGVLLAQVTSPQAKIAVAAAGNIPYFANRFSIDLLGKVDKVIAHEPIHSGPRGEGLVNLQPGHLKWDYARSIGEQKPDVIVDLILNTGEEVAPYLVDYQKVLMNGHTVYFRSGSANIYWDKIVNGQYQP
jgi:arabinofuranosyltransferase